MILEMWLELWTSISCLMHPRVIVLEQDENPLLVQHWKVIGDPRQ